MTLRGSLPPLFLRNMNLSTSSLSRTGLTSLLVYLDVENKGSVGLHAFGVTTDRPAWLAASDSHVCECGHNSIIVTSVARLPRPCPSSTRLCDQHSFSFCSCRVVHTKQWKTLARTALMHFCTTDPLLLSLLTAAAFQCSIIAVLMLAT